jgi:hypothetical protein
MTTITDTIKKKNILRHAIPGPGSRFRSIVIAVPENWSLLEPVTVQVVGNVNRKQ